MAEQQVGCLQIAVNDPVVMEMRHPAEQLDHQRLHLSRDKRVLHRLHQTLEVVFHVVHHDVDLVHVAAHHDLLQHTGAAIIFLRYKIYYA